MNKRIQIIRAVAAIAVVVIHCLDYSYGLSTVLIRPFLNFAVAMFIFLSGYLTKATVSNCCAFYKKRIFKILFPYIIWTVLYAIICGNYADLFSNLLTGNAERQFYYLLVYAQLVLLTPWIGRLLQSKYRFVGWLITPLYLIAVRYLFRDTFAAIGFPFPATLFCAWFIYYYLGMALGNGLISIKQQYRKLPMSCILFLVYGLCIALSFVEGMYWDRLGSRTMALTQIKLTSCLASLAACLLAYDFILRRQEKETIFNRVFVKIGDLSFGIYLSHVAVMRLLEYIPNWTSLPIAIISVSVFALSTLLVWLARCLLGRKIGGFFGI